MKLQQLTDPLFNRVRFSKSITITERNGMWYINGRIYYKDTFEYVRKSTNKPSNKQNYNWILKNQQQVLWDLSNYKKELEKMVEDAKDKNKILFSDFSEMVLDTKFMSVGDEEYGISKHTMEEYSIKYKKHLYPFFKGYFINDIDVDLVEKWQLWVMSKKYKDGSEKNNKYDSQPKLSIKTLKNIRIVLNLILKNAELKRLIDRNPLDLVKVPKVSKKGKKPIKFLPISDIQTIINGFDGFIDEVNREIDKKSRTQLTNIFMVMIGSGLRSGEVIGLKWEDIDFENQTISISRRIRKGDVDKPKTHSSIRKISVLNETMVGLQKQKEMNRDNEWVFVNRDGNPFSNTYSVDITYKKLLSFVGLPTDKIYNLRHTYATNIIHSGMESITTVSRLLGHNDSVVTQKTYISNEIQSDKIKGQSIFG